jgi:hypothetical protein
VASIDHVGPQFPVVGSVIHGDEYITSYVGRGGGLGLEWASVTTQEVLVSADVGSKRIILARRFGPSSEDRSRVDEAPEDLDGTLQV